MSPANNWPLRPGYDWKETFDDPQFRRDKGQTPRNPPDAGYSTDPRGGQRIARFQPFRPHRRGDTVLQAAIPFKMIPLESGTAVFIWNGF